MGRPSLRQVHTTPLGATRDRSHDSDYPLATARFTVRRDATSRSDGRVTDVLTDSGSANRQTGVLLANPTSGAIAPAALAEFTRRAVSDAAPIYDDPHDVLSRLDDMLGAEHPDVFMTALFGSTRQHDHGILISISNRGHALPLVISAGIAHPVGPQSTILGLAARRDLGGVVSQVSLGRGDQLLLVNDRPSDLPIPQPHRPEIERDLPIGASDHDLAEHVIEVYGATSVDVIVISATSGCDL